MMRVFSAHLRQKYAEKVNLGCTDAASRQASLSSLSGAKRH